MSCVSWVFVKIIWWSASRTRSYPANRTISYYDQWAPINKCASKLISKSVFGGPWKSVWDNWVTSSCDRVLECCHIRPWRWITPATSAKAIMAHHRGRPRILRCWACPWVVHRSHTPGWYRRRICVPFRTSKCKTNTRTRPCHPTSSYSSLGMFQTQCIIISTLT